MWRSSDQNADLRDSLCLGPVATHWDLVLGDTGLWLLHMKPQIQRDISALERQLFLEQYAAELEQNIPLQRRSVVELASHSSDKSVGPLEESSKNLLLLAVAVGGLAIGNSEQCFVAQPTVKYFQQTVAYLQERN